VVGGDHEVKGEAVHAYVITEDDQEETEALRGRIVEAVDDAIGPIARPERVVFTGDLPKTRSGKIMRRLLENVSDGKPLGDTSTLRNPEVVEEIQRRAAE
jgi:acetyl-CoA synthetase